MASHPLDPLTEDEFRRTAAGLSGATRTCADSFRFAGHRAARAAQGRGEGLAPRRRRARAPRSPCCGTARTTPTWEAVVDLDRRPVTSWTQVEGVTPNFTVDEYHEVDEAMRAHPDVIAALAARGITDMSLVLIEVWTYGKALMPPQYADRRLGWCDIWYRETPDGNPYAHPVSGLKLVVDMNTLRAARARGRPRPRASPTSHGEYAPGPWTGEHRDRPQAAAHHPARGHLASPSTAPSSRWQNWSMRLGFNYREGPVIYQVTYDDHGDGPRHRLPDVLRRDGGALPRRVVRPLPPDGVRHRRVGPGLHDHLARARLRLPRRDRLPRRGAARHRGRALHDHQRDLPPRGGQRRPLEARRRPHRRRGPADAPARGLLPRHGRQLRVPRLLALLPGRQHRVRGPRHRADGDHAVRARR